MPSTKDFTNVDVSNYDNIPIDNARMIGTRLNASYNITVDEEESDDELVSQRELYFRDRPFLSQLLPPECFFVVECDEDLHTLLQTHDFYTNHWDSWCQILACLFEWAGEECGPSRNVLHVDFLLANYVGRNYRDFVRYLNYVRRNEESLRWGTTLNL